MVPGGQGSQVTCFDHVTQPVSAVTRPCRSSWSSPVDNCPRRNPTCPASALWTAHPAAVRTRYAPPTWSESPRWLDDEPHSTKPLSC